MVPHLVLQGANGLSSWNPQFQLILARTSLGVRVGQIFNHTEERSEAEPMRRPAVQYIKVCGITSREDIAIALDAGVDALGFLVGLNYSSEDELSADAAFELIRDVPPYVSTVLVTHRTELVDVLALCERTRPSTLQLHGNFPIGLISNIRVAHPTVKIIKAVHVTGNESIAIARTAAASADALLLDTLTSSRLGGTGIVHDWSISREIRQSVERPIILAGGLNPDNVAQAIDLVRPFAVDVNTGVSLQRGVKDVNLVRRFVAAARGSSSLTGTDSDAECNGSW